MSVVYFHYHPSDHGFAVQLAALLERNGLSVAGLHGPNTSVAAIPLNVAALNGANCIAILCSFQAAGDPNFINPSVLSELTDKLVFVSIDGSRPSDRMAWAEACSLADLTHWDGLTESSEFNSLLDFLKGVLINSAVKAVAAATDKSAPESVEHEESLEQLELNARKRLDDLLVAGGNGSASAALNPQLGTDGLASLLATYQMNRVSDAPEPSPAARSSPLAGTMHETAQEADVNRVTDTMDTYDRLKLAQSSLDVGAASEYPRTRAKGFGAAPSQPLNPADAPIVFSPAPQAEAETPLAANRQSQDEDHVQSRRSRLTAIELAVIAGGLAAVGWYFGRQIIEFLSDALAAIIALKGTLPPGSAAGISDTETPADDVDCTVFAPPSALPGDTILVQVFLHMPEHSERADKLATTFDETAKPRMFQSLDMQIPRGSKVDIVFDCQDLNVEMRSQKLTWRGRPEACNFLVTLPETQSPLDYFPIIQVSLDGTPIGRIQFKLSADTAASSNTLAAEPRGDSAGRYRYAFLSYASKDRTEVLKRAQSLRATNIDFFQDILSLDPGERWESALYSHIDRCDLFLLFWSKAAAESEWVLKEIEYALDKRRASGEDVPDIKPIILETPPPLPPTHLKSGLGQHHLDDYLGYLISALPAEETSRQGQGPAE